MKPLLTDELRQQLAKTAQERKEEYLREAAADLKRLEEVLDAATAGVSVTPRPTTNAGGNGKTRR